MIEPSAQPLPVEPELWSPEFLERMVTLLDGVFTGDWDGPNRLVRIDRAPDPDGFDLGFLELDGHPADVLTAYRPPATTEVLGVIAFGWATQYGQPGQPRQRVRTIALVDRTGHIACTSCLRDGTTIDQAPAGAIPALLRRALAPR